LHILNKTRLNQFDYVIRLALYKSLQEIKLPLTNFRRVAFDKQ